jgi:hypothetical protein
VPRNVVRLEDLIFAAALVAVGLADPGMVFDGGAGTLLLLVAALGFFLVAVTAESGDETPRALYVVLAGGLGCAIVVEMTLRQLDAAPWLRLVQALGTLLLAAFLLLQHWRKRGGAWLRLPRAVRRAAAAPYVALTGGVGGTMIEVLVDPRKPLWNSEGDVRYLVFKIGAMVLLFLPMIFAFFVALPRMLADPRAPSKLGAWAIRYGLALVAAALSVLLDALVA